MLFGFLKMLRHRLHSILMGMRDQTVNLNTVNMVHMADSNINGFIR